jgi:hypothetical protein
MTMEGGMAMDGGMTMEAMTKKGMGKSDSG